jgi:hypothetical protein
MATPIDFEVNLDNTSFKELRQEIRALNGEFLDAKKAGKDTSQILHELAERKSEMRELNKEIKELDPNRQAESFAHFGHTIASGFSAAAGATALFGVENEKAAAKIAQLEGAIALMQGMQGLADAKRQFNILKTVALTKLQTAAESENIIVKYTAIAVQKALNAVQEGSPLGLAIVAVLAIVTAIAAWNSASETLAEKLREENKLLDENIELAEKERKSKEESADADIKLAKAKGATDEQVGKMTKSKIEESKKQLEKEINEQQKALDNQKTINKAKVKDHFTAWQSIVSVVASGIGMQGQMMEKYANDNKESNAALRKELSEKRIKLEEFNAELKKLDAERLETDKELKEKQEKQRKEEADNAKKAREDRIKSNRELTDLKILNISDERARDIAELTERIKRQEEDLKRDKNYIAKKKELATELANGIAAINKKFDDDEKKKRDDAEQQKRQDEIDSYAAEMEGVEEENKRLAELQQQQLDEQRKTQEAQNSIATSGAAALVSLGDLLQKKGKDQTDAQKALALIQIAIKEAVSIANIVESSTANPLNSVTFGAAGVAQAAAGLAELAANIAAAKNILDGGSPSGSLSSAGAGVSASPPRQISSTQFGPTPKTDNQGRTDYGYNGMVKTYVTQTDLSEAQGAAYYQNLNRRGK